MPHVVTNINSRHSVFGHFTTRTTFHPEQETRYCWHTYREEDISIPGVSESYDPAKIRLLWQQKLN